MASGASKVRNSETNSNRGDNQISLISFVQQWLVRSFVHCAVCVMLLSSSAYHVSTISCLLLAASFFVGIQQVDNHRRLGRGWPATAWRPLACCRGCGGAITTACRGCPLRLACRHMRCTACEHPYDGCLDCHLRS